MADLTLRILDEETSEPIPGARVALAVNPLGGASDLLRGESDSSGVCRLNIPLGEGQWARVAPLVEARGYEPHQPGDPEKMQWWESRRLTIQLRRGPYIVGLVTDEEGRPLAEAEVQIGFKVRGGITSAPPQVGFGWRIRRTDGDGRFEWIAHPGSMAGRAKGEWVLVVQHPLFERAEVVGLLEMGTDEEGCIPLEVTLESGLLLDGTVLGPDDLPLPDALIRLTPRDRQAGGPGDLRWCRTDESGRFHLGGLLPRPYVIHAWADGAAPVSKEVDVASDPRQEVILNLGRGSSLEGQVIDAHGKGVPGVEVQAWPSPAESAGRGLTDGTGLFRISALPSVGEITLHLWHRLHESRHKIRLPSEPVRIGFPLIDFRARLFSSEDDEPLESCGQILFRNPKGGIRGIPIRQGGDAGPVSIKPGIHEMTAVVPHWLAKEFRVEVPDWGLKGPVDIWMSQGKEIRGRTVDLEGNPLGGILITAYGRRLGEEQVAMSDPSGEFHLGGLGKTIHVVARGDGWAPTMEDDLSPETSVEIRMGPGAIAFGDLRGGNGEPVPGMEVLALRRRAGESILVRGVFTDPRGHYRFSRLPAGDYILRAGRWSREVSFSHGDDVRIDFGF